jgi:hypothetical protein
MTLNGTEPNWDRMCRKSCKEDEMKNGQGLLKRNHKLADLSNRPQIDSTTIAEKASTVQKVIKKKFAAQPIAKKTCGKMPGRLCVLVIVQNSEEGLDPKTVKHLTGFNRQKVHKILYKLFKHGEIKIERGGLYVGVKKRYSIPMVN